jgi:predicted nucleic acid-binding protein
MIVYLDTSVILSRFLGQPNMLSSWGGWERVYTSIITRVEYLRTVDRLRLQGSIDDEARVELNTRFESLWRAIFRVPLAESILTRAAQSFPTVIGTLDALHLASALAARSDAPGELTVLTHDQQFGRAASALGLRVVGLGCDDQNLRP